MTAPAHLWAIAYDDPARAQSTRQTILQLSGKGGTLQLLDTAILERHPDGAFTLDRKPLPTAAAHHHSTLSLLIGMAIAGPLSGSDVDAMLGDTSSNAPNPIGIDANFIVEIKTLLKPGVAALLVLDQVGKLDEILPAIRGLGGTVVKTNVDLDRAKLIQSTLNQGPPDPMSTG
jgi:uncharacterized membrane protein